MSAAAVLKAALDAGVLINVDGEDLVLEAAIPPPAALVNLLTANKRGIMAMLLNRSEVWSAEDWRLFFEERAGVAEFDGHLPRPQAEARAFDCCVVEWLDRNPVSSMPGRCLGCGSSDRAHDPLLPYGFAWLHRCCWPIWHERRMAEAVAALAVMGIRAVSPAMKDPNTVVITISANRDAQHDSSQSRGVGQILRSTP